MVWARELGLPILLCLAVTIGELWGQGSCVLKTCFLIVLPGLQQEYLWERCLSFSSCCLGYPLLCDFHCLILYQQLRVFVYPEIFEYGAIASYCLQENCGGVVKPQFWKVAVGWGIKLMTLAYFSSSWMILQQKILETEIGPYHASPWQWRQSCRREHHRQPVF